VAHAVTTEWLGPFQRRRDEERRKPARLALVHLHRGVVDRLQAADAGADHHAAGPAILVGLRLPAGILDRADGRDHREVDELVHLLLVFERDPLVDVEPPVGARAGRHLTGDGAGEVLGVERLDRADAGPAFDQPPPDRLGAYAERARDAHAGHDDAALERRHGEAGQDQPAFCFSM
jgi:hypothetical protein